MHVTPACDDRAVRKRVQCVREELGKVMAGFDARLVDARDAAVLVEEFGAIERMAAAGRALAAARVARTKVWAETGDRSAAHWLARTSGTTVGQAVAVLETARHLDGLDATADALRAGDLSLEQAGAIAKAATADPHAERELLSTAAEAGVDQPREECRRVESAARVDEVAHDDAIRRGRFARQWVDPDGAWRLSVRDTVAAGARLWAAVEAEQARLAGEAGAQGRREPHEALAADALLSLATRDGVTDDASGPRATVHVRVDHAALVRGHAERGEVCEIPGLGPIPVVTARALAADALLSVLVTRGVEVVGVAHTGRTIRANVRRAMEERSRTCEVPGCAVRAGLEVHHVRGYAVTKETKLHDLARVCGWHHYLMTHHGHTLVGTPGAWEWRTPAGRRADDRAPPAAA
jgi:hypothetical protein